MSAEKSVEMLGRPMPIKLSRVVPFKGQPRKLFEAKALEDLVQSILSEGQKTPIKVCVHPEKSGTFILIGGERRWRALNIIWERSGTEPTIDAFIDASPNSYKDHYREALIDNLHREDLTPLEHAASFAQLLKDGMSVVRVAELVGKSRTHVENYLRLDSLPEAVKALMDPILPKEQRLNTSTAAEIAKVKNPSLQTSIAKEAVERQLGIVETRALISVRNKTAGFSLHGRKRKPVDDYKVWVAFIHRTYKAAKHYNDELDVDRLYLYREDEEADRKSDASYLRAAISFLQKLLVAVESKK